MLEESVFGVEVSVLVVVLEVDATDERDAAPDEEEDSNPTGKELDATSEEPCGAPEYGAAEATTVTLDDTGPM